jgi:hypothetical protein
VALQRRTRSADEDLTAQGGGGSTGILQVAENTFETDSRTVDGDDHLWSGRDSASKRNVRNEFHRGVEEPLPSGTPMFVGRQVSPAVLAVHAVGDRRQSVPGRVDRKLISSDGDRVQPLVVPPSTGVSKCPVPAMSGFHIAARFPVGKPPVGDLATLFGANSGDLSAKVPVVRGSTVRSGRHACEDIELLSAQITRANGISELWHCVDQACTIGEIPCGPSRTSGNRCGPEGHRRVAVVRNVLGQSGRLRCICQPPQPGNELELR